MDASQLQQLRYHVRRADSALGQLSAREQEVFMASAIAGYVRGWMAGTAGLSLEEMTDRDIVETVMMTCLQIPGNQWFREIVGEHSGV